MVKKIPDIEELDVLHKRAGLGSEWMSSSRRKEIVEFVPELSAVMYQIQFCLVCKALLIKVNPLTDQPRDLILGCPNRHLTIRWMLTEKGWLLMVETARLIELRNEPSVVEGDSAFSPEMQERLNSPDPFTVDDVRDLLEEINTKE